MPTIHTQMNQRRQDPVPYEGLRTTNSIRSPCMQFSFLTPGPNLRRRSAARIDLRESSNSSGKNKLPPAHGRRALVAGEAGCDTAENEADGVVRVWMAKTSGRLVWIGYLYSVTTLWEVGQPGVKCHVYLIQGIGSGVDNARAFDVRPESRALKARAHLSSLDLPTVLLTLVRLIT